MEVFAALACSGKHAAALRVMLIYYNKGISTSFLSNILCVLFL
jgi:hypothetical protein